jgi:hypothetical protein
LIFLVAFTVLAASRSSNQRKRQVYDSSDGSIPKERVSNGNDDLNAELPSSDQDEPHQSLNPMIGIPGLGGRTPFDTLGDEEGEISGPYPKNLNDFYKGNRAQTER